MTTFTSKTVQATGVYPTTSGHNGTHLTPTPEERSMSAAEQLETTFGHVPHSRMTLPIQSLHVDHPVQRNLNRRKAQQMYTVVGSYLPALAGALDVSKRSDGTYWVMDGQHRLAVAEMAEKTKVECEVYVGLTRDQENLFFRLKNDRRLRVTSSAMEMWWSAFEGHDQATQDQARILASYGYEIAHQRGQAMRGSPNQIMAVKAVQDIYARGGADWLRRVLGLIRDAFPDDPEALRQEVLLGAFDFLREFGEQIRYQDLLYKVRHTTATTMIAEANMITEYSSKRLRVTEWLRRTYNKGRRTSAGRMLLRRERFNARFANKDLETPDLEGADEAAPTTSGTAPVNATC